MSSEWQEPGTGATWQGANQLQWDDAYEDVPSSPSQNATIPPAEKKQSAAAFDFPPESAASGRSSEANIEFPARSNSFFEAVRRIGKQFLPVLIPLLLVGLTLIFILPLSLHNQAYVHGDQLWPLMLVILALAALQGTILFYTDTNEGLWSLAVTGGFGLFVVIAAFALGGPYIAIILLLLFAILAIFAIRLYMRRVPDGYVDVTYAFEKPNRALLPGVNFLLPWESVKHHFQTREAVWTSPEQVVQVSRDENVHLKAMVSYQLSADDALLVAAQYEKWEQNLHDLICATLQMLASHLTPEDVLIWPQGSRSYQGLPARDDVTRWERLNNKLYHQLRDKAANWGVEVNWAQARDISLTPRAAYVFDRDATVKAAPPQGSGRAGPDENATERMPGSSALGAQPGQSGIDLDSTPVTPTKLLSEKLLIQAYEQVRSEKITTPAAIRQIAAQFDAIANNPELSKTMSFDAAQAARILYDRAAIIERQPAREAPVDDEPAMSRSSGAGPRLPRDENLTGGG